MKSQVLAVAVALCTGFAVLTSARPEAQDWQIKPSSDPGKVHFTMERRRPGHRWVQSSDVSLDRFRGLSLGSSGAVTFEYVSDAGRLVCEGQMLRGRGLGTFEFVPNAQFVSEMEKLGYGTPDSNELFSMMMSHITLEFARGVRQAGIASTTKELVDMGVHGIDLEYIRKMSASGYPNLVARDYVEMRIHGVTPELVTELKQAGYEVPSKQIVELKIHGVSPQYVRELKRYGLRPDAKELVEMKIHGISPEYLKGMQEAGHARLGVAEAVNLKIHGVSPEFARQAKDLGYSFTAKELTEMRIHGVDGAYLQKLKSSGFQNLSADKIVKLRIHGID